MSGLRLGVDLDGVVADFNAGWITRYNRDFGADLHPSMVTTWNSPTVLTHFEDMDSFWAWARQGSSSVFRDLPVYPGAVDTLRTLAATHRVVVVSSKHEWAISDTLAWLGEQRVPTSEVHFVWDKPSVACDVYLEDAPHNLQALASRRAESVVCRMVQPWNAPVGGVRDVASWQEFATLVEALARQTGTLARQGQAAQPAGPGPADAPVPER